MIIDPILPKDYDVPLRRKVWFKDEQGEWYTREFPVVTVECESFEEFRACQMDKDVISSRQPNPWYVSFTHAGPCGGCDWFIHTANAGDYLCANCRDALM